MKKLTNVSPFLLLLVPVFLMMVVTLSVNAANPQTENELASKTTATKGALIKINFSNPFAK